MNSFSSGYGGEIDELWTGSFCVSNKKEELFSKKWKNMFHAQKILKGHIKDN